MSAIPKLGLLAALTLSIVPGILSAQRFVQARINYENEAKTLNAALRDAQEIMDLRQHQERISLHERPTQDVIAQVNTALAEAGIPANRLKSLTPESEGAVEQSGGGANGGTTVGYRKQSLRLTLENLSVQEFGAFLLQWRRSQKVWVVTRIELGHARGKADQDDRYDANVLLTALYIAQEAQRP